MIKSFQRYKRNKEIYFLDGEDEIAKSNLATLFQVTGAAVLVVCLLMVITPLIISGWVPTLTHVLLVPTTVMFFIVAFFLRRKKEVSNRVVNGVCLLFVACIFAFVIRLDVFEYTSAPSSFMEAVLLVIPVIFIFQFRVIYAEVAVFELIYCVCTFLVKDDGIARSDVFNSIVGFLLSVVVSVMIQKLRAESYHAQKQYRKLSMTDGLTGIMNKANCEHFVRQYLEEKMPLEKCAMLILDVDDFKGINDSMGHQMGDAILSEMGSILDNSFRNSDILGRIGGDEFMVMMRGIQDKDIVEKKCKKIFDDVKKASKIYKLDLSCSIGIGILDDKDVEYGELFQVADDALYEAKATGKARYSIHTVNEDLVEHEDEKPLALIADDNEMNRVILKAALEKHFRFVEADTGRKAIEQIGKYRNQLAVVILDLVMPEVDGYHVLEYMSKRKSISRIPVVVITADSTSEKDVLQLGAVDMISKPFDAEIVELRVLNVLKGRSKLIDHKETYRNVEEGGEHIG